MNFLSMNLDHIERQIYKYIIEHLVYMRYKPEENVEVSYVSLWDKFNMAKNFISICNLISHLQLYVIGVLLHSISFGILSFNWFWVTHDDFFILCTWTSVLMIFSIVANNEQLERFFKTDIVHLYQFIYLRMYILYLISKIISHGMDIQWMIWTIN